VAHFIGVVMVSVLASSAVDCLCNLCRVKSKTAMCIYCIPAKHVILRRKCKDGWLGIRIKCLSRVTCIIPADISVS